MRGRLEEIIRPVRRSVLLTSPGSLITPLAREVACGRRRVAGAASGTQITSSALEQDDPGPVRVGTYVWDGLLPPILHAVGLGTARRIEQFLIGPIAVGEIGTHRLLRRRCRRQVRIAFEDHVIAAAARTTRDPCRSRPGVILIAEHHRILLSLKQLLIAEVLVETLGLLASTCRNECPGDGPDEVQEATATAATNQRQPACRPARTYKLKLLRSCYFCGDCVGAACSDGFAEFAISAHSPPHEQPRLGRERVGGAPADERERFYACSPAGALISEQSQPTESDFGPARDGETVTRM